MKKAIAIVRRNKYGNVKYKGLRGYRHPKYAVLCQITDRESKQLLKHYRQIIKLRGKKWIEFRRTGYTNISGWSRARNVKKHIVNKVNQSTTFRFRYCYVEDDMLVRAVSVERRLTSRNLKIFLRAKREIVFKTGLYAEGVLRLFTKEERDLTTAIRSSGPSLASAWWVLDERSVWKRRFQDHL